MKVSILTPYYNGGKYIEAAIDSVLSQYYQNYEMIIVNDASPDNPDDLLHQLQKKDERIKVYHHRENKGIAEARNTAIKNAKGDCFALLDQDDMWLPDKLKMQIKVFEENPHVGLVFSNYFRTDEVGIITGKGEKCHRIVADTDEQTLINLFMKNRITACSVAFRRKCVETLGAFRADLKGGTDDYEMWLRIAGSYSLKYINLPLVKRRSHGENTSGRFMEQGMLDHILIMEELSNLYPFLAKYKAQRLSKIFYNLGRYYNKRHNNADARVYFKKMKELEPLNIKPYIGILKSFFHNIRI